MGVGFNWFKKYKLVKEEQSWWFGKDVKYRVEYLSGDDTSHGYGNRTKLQNIFRKYLNTEIPTVDDYLYKKRKINLIEPALMSEYCNKLLSNKNYDLGNMKDRIEWIKKISDEGYYVSYDIS